MRSSPEGKGCRRLLLPVAAGRKTEWGLPAESRAGRPFAWVCAGADFLRAAYFASVTALESRSWSQPTAIKLPP